METPREAGQRPLLEEPGREEQPKEQCVWLRKEATMERSTTQHFTDCVQRNPSPEGSLERILQPNVLRCILALAGDRRTS